METAYLALLISAAVAVICRYSIQGEFRSGLAIGMAAVFYNWAVNTAFVFGSGGYAPWAFFLATDLACLLILLSFARCPWGTTLASTYAGQIIMHMLHGAGGGDDYRYWQILTLLGFGQLGLLIVWAAAPWGTANEPR